MAPFQAIFWNLHNRDVRYACQSSLLQAPAAPFLNLDMHSGKPDVAAVFRLAKCIGVFA